jgi:DNA polymerase-4
MVMGFILDETPLVEQVSIDEAFFDVSPGRFSKESPIAICQRIQQRVSELGITCSIGVGVNKTVAKIASERQKPRGLTVVLPGTEATFLSPLPVRAMSGIGKACESRLRALGVSTLGQLAQMDPREMESAFGVAGPRMIERAAGLEVSAVRDATADERVKSVSNERTFVRDLTGRTEVVAAIRHVGALVGTRLRSKGLAGHQVTLKIRIDKFRTKTAQCQLDERTDDEHVFGEAAVGLLDKIWTEGTPVRLVGVAVSGFEYAHAFQMSLLDQEAEAMTRRRGELRNLSIAADKVRERFGKDALAYGRDMRFREGTSGSSPLGDEGGKRN